MRRVLGAAVVVGALAIAFGLDTGFLARVSTASTTQARAGVVRAAHAGAQPAAARRRRLAAGARDGGRSANGGAMMSGNNAMMRGDGATTGGAMMSARGAAGALPVEGMMPPLDGATQWLNSEPLTREGLRGKVVLVDFWTYSCINCIRALPYVKAWYEKYRDQGLVVIGVHSPEFAFEKNLQQRAARSSRPRRHVSRRGRQRLRDLARIRESILARALLHRRDGQHPPHALRRRRVRPVRARDPAAARGSRQRRLDDRARRS